MAVALLTGDDGAAVLRVAVTADDHAELELSTGVAPLRCVVPFEFAVSPRTQERMRWYAEDYAARPIEPAPSIAADVERELQQLGESLFDALLTHLAATPIAERLPALMDCLRVEVATDFPAADALPWELLRDPRSGADLAVSARSVTRTTSTAAVSSTAVRDDAAVRILLVIARPEGRLDVGFRSVADPLLRELTASGASVEVDVLRPPTFERLQDVIRSASRPYDLLHFDGHGVFDENGGALVFESGDEAGTLVTGGVLGDELRAGAVPLLVMNACRSAAGRQDEAYGSVAREALERGLAAVVAMRFNVYVPTAALFVGGLYRALGEGRELPDAVTQARRVLIERTDRGGLPLLRDWYVPALYQAAPVRLAGVGTGATRRAEERALPPAPRHGFVGRDEVFVDLEAALVGSPHALLRGIPGLGKTSLATEFARWYARTGGCGVAGPCISLAETAGAAELRERIGPVTGQPLLLWDDARDLTGDHMRLLVEVAEAGGRVLIIRDRRPDPDGLPIVPMPNFPSEEAFAFVLAVAAEVGATIAPEAAMALGDRLHGHALAIELAVRELARRGSVRTAEDLETVLEELRTPTNGDPAPWTRTLSEQLDVAGMPRDATLAAQFRGYVSVFGLASLRGDEDFDAVDAALAEMTARGLMTPAGPAVYAIHPGLPVALAAAGRYEPPGRAFAQAVADAASAWAMMAEAKGMEVPWGAEASNIVAARRLASRNGWWPLVTELLVGVTALAVHGDMPDVRRSEVLAAAPDFVDLETGEPRPGMEELGAVFPGQLAWIAESEGDMAKAARLYAVDVAHRRAMAATVLAVAPDRRTEEQDGLIRRLAVGLTNLGPVQRVARHRDALETMTEAARLAHELGDWRLETSNRLNLGVYWMTVPDPPDFDRADAEFVAGYKLAIEGDPPFAGKLMTERGTVHYERGRATRDPREARKEYERAAQLLDLAVGLREPDAVLCHQLGQVHRHLGNLGEARTWFEQAIALRELEHEPGAGADARLHLALTLEAAGLLAEALRFAHSAEQVIAEALEPDATLRQQIEQTIGRLVLIA